MVSEKVEINLSDEQSEAFWLLTPMPDLVNPGEYIYSNRYSKTYRIIYGGAAYGGKSTLISAWLDHMCNQYEGTRYYLGRETLKDIKESVLLTFFDFIKQSGSRVKYSEQKSKLTYYNGSEIYLLETFNYPADPNFDRLGSREYTAGAIEEGVTTVKRASDLLLSRTRYKHLEFGLKPKQLITLNPGEGWIKDDIVIPTLETGKAKRPFDIFVAATLNSNPNKAAAEEYRKNLEENLSSYDRERLLNGNWNAKPKLGAEVLKDFNQDVHVKPQSYNPRLPLHLSFDENVNPHMTLGVYQIHEFGGSNKVKQIMEFCPKPPTNTRKRLCDLIAKTFQGHNAGMFIYGDQTSEKNDTGKEYGENFFTDILLYLNIFNPRLKLPPKNPPVMSKIGFLNIILEKEYQGIALEVDPGCKFCIDDYSYAIEDANGGILKKRVTDPNTGISYEKHGHGIDQLSYFMCEAFLKQFNSYLVGGRAASYDIGNDRTYKFER